MKVTTAQFKKFITEEAKKLYKKSLLESEKEGIKKQLSKLNEDYTDADVVTDAPSSLKEENDDYTTKTYKFSVKHDKGKKNITTTGSSEEAAKEKIAKAEGCPLSAITKISK